MENNTVTFTERWKNKSRSSCTVTSSQSGKNLCMYFLLLYSPIDALQITEFWFTSHINKKRRIIPKIINFLTEIKK